VKSSNPGGEKLPSRIARSLSEGLCLLIELKFCSGILLQKKNSPEKLLLEKKKYLKLLRIAPWNSDYHWRIANCYIDIQQHSVACSVNIPALLSSSASAILLLLSKEQDDKAKYQSSYLLGYAEFFRKNYIDALNHFKDASSHYQVEYGSGVYRLYEDAAASALVLGQAKAANSFYAMLPQDLHNKEIEAAIGRLVE
jgi:hypothetical protein